MLQLEVRLRQYKRTDKDRHSIKGGTSVTKGAL